MSLYKLTAKAWTDYFSAYDFVESSSQQGAARWESRMLKAFEYLGENRMTGPIRAEYAPAPYRFWFVEDYVICYNPLPEKVLIIGILHGAQMLAVRFAERLESDETS